jgi:hypothetical protein
MIIDWKFSLFLIIYAVSKSTTNECVRTVLSTKRYIVITKYNLVFFSQRDGSRTFVVEMNVTFIQTKSYELDNTVIS